MANKSATKEAEKSIEQRPDAPVGGDSSEDDEGCKQARVSFRRIEVHEHSYMLGDNPSVSGGAPLTLSWKNQGSAEFDIDDYESERSQRPPRNSKASRLSNSDRAALLLQSGYSMEDIVRRSLEVHEEKDLRAESRRNQKWDGLNLAIGKTTSKLKKVVRRGSLLAATPFRKAEPSRGKMQRRHSATGPVVTDAEAVTVPARSA